MLMGIQVLIQLQCNTLVENFDVNIKVVDATASILLRFLATEIQIV